MTDRYAYYGFGNRFFSDSSVILELHPYGYDDYDMRSSRGEAIWAAYLLNGGIDEDGNKFPVPA